MTEDQESVSKILSVLSHKIRREILLILRDKGEASFTDLKNSLNIDTGKLSFHMRSLQPFIEQTETVKYRLSRTGEAAVRVIVDVESWAEAAGINMTSTSQLPLASYMRRIYAFLTDFSIMLALSVLLLLGNLLSAGANWVVVVLNPIFVALGLIWVYSTLFEGFNGQTIGKRVFGLKVVQTDGKKLSYDRAAVRNFGKVLLPFDLFFGYRLHDARFIRYFDRFAGTTVIDLRKQLVP